MLHCLQWPQERENTSLAFKPELEGEREEGEYKGEAEESFCSTLAKRLISSVIASPGHWASNLHLNNANNYIPAFQHC